MSQKSENLNERSAWVLETASGLLWAKPAVGKKLAKSLLSQAEASLKALVPRLSESNDQAAQEAFFALEGMVILAGAEDFDPELRNSFAVALADSLPSAADHYSRSQLIRFFGSLGVVPKTQLGYWLNQEEYFEITLQTLAQAGDENAFELIQEKMAEAGHRQFCALATAISQWGEVYSIDEQRMQTALAEAKPEELPGLWLACLRTELNIVFDSMMAACKGKSKSLAANAANILADYYCGHEEPGSNIDLVDWLYHDYPAPATFQALYKTLEQIEPEAMLTLLWETIKQGEPLMLDKAFEMLSMGPQLPFSSECLLKRFADFKPADLKVRALRLLGESKHLIARPYVMSCLWDPSAEVRAAAAEAAEKLLGKLPQEYALAAAVYRK
ncbi:MAG: hypothetical protein RBT25_05345 [Lentisphaeria bacterium]|nr:hypothetical protein [Lentisphaeria bacterium]